MELKALCLVRPIRQAVFWGRDPDKAEAAACEMAETLGIEVRAEPDSAKAAAEADVMVTTTPSRTPMLRAAWLRPGQHVTAMGSDQHDKNELEPECLAAPISTCRTADQTRTLGELRSAIAAGLAAADAAFGELGAVVAGTAPGRRGPEAITIADLTGTGVQDTVIATCRATRDGGRGRDRNRELKPREGARA